MRSVVCAASVLLMAVGAVVPPAAFAGALEAINDIRSRGCGNEAGGRSPLRIASRLNDAAVVYAGGVRLRESLGQAGYPSSRSTAMHVRHISDDDRVLARVLSDQFCAELLDNGYREMGSIRRDKEIWIVLAQPFVAPSPAAAASISRQMLQLVNQARASPRTCGSRRFPVATPVRLNAVLGRAALIQARDMAARKQMSHAGSDGSNVAARVTRVGYKWRAVAENVAAGQETPGAALDAWLASPGHCANLMSANYTEMGIAYAGNPASEPRVFWAQVFAAPKSGK